MLSWNELQNAITLNGKCTIPIESAFGMQIVSKIPNIDSTFFLRQLNTLYALTNAYPDKYKPTFSYNDTYWNQLFNMINKLRSVDNIWQHMVNSSNVGEFSKLSDASFFNIYLSTILCPEESPKLYDTYIAIGASAFDMRMYTVGNKFLLDRFVSSGSFEDSIPGILASNNTHDAVDFNDPLVDAIQRCILLSKEFPDTNVSSLAEYFYRNNDIKYLKADLKAKPVNDNAAQLLFTFSDGSPRELFLVTMNHHQVFLNNVSSKIAWCVAFAPDSYMDVPLSRVIEEMSPVYDKKFSDKLSPTRRS